MPYRTRAHQNRGALSKDPSATGGTMRHTRTTVATVVGAAIALALAGCSLLSPAVLGPPRDADGRVTKPAEINSSTLEVGDCFTFVEGTNMATVTPCALEHTHIVIADGE